MTFRDLMNVLLGAILVTTMIMALLSPLLYLAYKQEREFTRACEKRGGRPVITRDLSACYSKDAFK